MKKGFLFKHLTVALLFSLGLFLGALWHWLWLFPFPQLHEWKAHRTRGGQEFHEPTGRWSKAATRASLKVDQQADDLSRQLQRLRSVGYLSGSKSAPSRSDVTVYDRNRAYEGLNLVVSGHAPEAILMDMSGQELHKWACDVFRAWPDFDPKQHFGSDKIKLHTFWRRAHLMPNGDLFALFSGIGLVKLDRHSNLIWSVQNGAHHDLYVARNGHIYVLTREVGIKPEYNAKEPISEDFITILNAKGEELRKISVLESLENSPYSPLFRRLRSSGDILHSNTIELLENAESHQLLPFRGGTLLISILYLDLVAAVDLEEETVVWAESDLWRRQHQPTLLQNGNILILNNIAAESTSCVFEFDPVSREKRWYYCGDKDNPFYTATCGSCQRLPNGNTLITESDPGRAFELTPDKVIVWEYVNPYRAGQNSELIATLFEVVRLKRDFLVEWLQ